MTQAASTICPPDTNAPRAPQDLDARRTHEIEHFDQHYAAEARELKPLSQSDRLRYANPPADTIFPREYFYHLLAPMRGLDTLEIACGNGIDACISASNGANVHAYDLSPAAIDLTRRRARASGLEDSLNLEVSGDFSGAFAGQTFDRILGYAALHHLPMEGLAEQIRGRLRPGGVAVFAEPVVNSRVLNAVRRCIPYSIHGETEDERPLDDQAIAAFARPFPRMVRREFQCVSRLWPLFPNCWTLAEWLHRADYQLMKAPFLRRFATVVVFALYRQ
jgi:2-polyprenyl-3-methyl-5-hydroxy-6-metoxy-1,4-benzoquinol methylase